ncbi:Dabb family protein [Thiolinea disciformis]|uniref:Dabb family protein n=1 Tax=Thiolinea disciformis TaxID=125614 RepID=UPI00035F954D|nr:Dabb family protein [Thiolinea disciformis]
MIKHCVFMQFREDVSLAEREAIYADLRAVEGQIQGWLGFVAGANSTDELGMDKGYNGGFIIDFADEAALASYQANADHKKAGARLVAASEGGLAGIFVFDLRL